MKKLGDLFNVYNGIASSNFEVKSEQFDNLIPFIRPSRNFEDTVAGYVKPKGYKIYHKGEIFISTDGEGSHTFTYVAPWDSFIPNSNVAVLIFKSRELKFLEKQYYAQYITKCRPLFSYGRKPKGDRLKNLLLPEIHEIPSWVYEIEIPDYSDIVEAKENKIVGLPDISRWREFLFPDIFNMIKGRGPSATEAKDNPGSIPYIGASAFNNGVTHYTNFESIHNGNSITIATDGSVGASFYQPKPFLATTNIVEITIKDKEMTPVLAMFLITVIEKIGQSFDYGRKWGITRMKESKISLPIDESGSPDWQLMENYIKSLPYSKYL